MPALDDVLRHIIGQVKALEKLFPGTIDRVIESLSKEPRAK